MPLPHPHFLYPYPSSLLPAARIISIFCSSHGKPKSKHVLFVVPDDTVHKPVFKSTSTTILGFWKEWNWIKTNPLTRWYYLVQKRDIFFLEYFHTLTINTHTAYLLHYHHDHPSGSIAKFKLICSGLALQEIKCAGLRYKTLLWADFTNKLTQYPTSQRIVFRSNGKHIRGMIMSGKDDKLWQHPLWTFPAILVYERKGCILDIRPSQTSRWFSEFVRYIWKELWTYGSYCTRTIKEGSFLGSSNGEPCCIPSINPAGVRESIFSMLSVS